MNRVKCLLIALSLLIAAGCATNYYVTAYNLQQRGNYIGAIENYDEFIARTNDGAMRTRALNYRSEAYYQLGLQAMERENYRLAIRYFYLANSDKADQMMIDCYLTLIDQADSPEDVEGTLGLFNFIIETFTDIPVISEIIYRRLVIIHEYLQDYESILENYLMLNELDQEGTYLAKARVIIDDYMPLYIEEAKNLEDEYEALDRLAQLLFFEHSYHDVIQQELGERLLAFADNYKNIEQFSEAEKYYLLAVELNPDLQAEVTERLNQTVSDIINKGDALLADRKVEEAIEVYRYSYSIIPDNPAAQRAISRAEDLKKNIREAEELFNRASRLENEGQYEEALRLYRQSYAKDRVPRTSEKISHVTNMIAIEENPEFFAEKIITEYKNGLIVRNLDRIAAELQDKYDDEINVSGWRVMLSTGSHRYEIRYDITSRAESMYFVWQTNLLTKQLTPLNRISAGVME